MNPAAARPGRGTRLDGCSLHEVAALASACELCRLCDVRRHATVGHGADDARVAFVVDAPGYHDDVAARPLAGAAGELFDELLLREVGIERTEAWVTSVVKCRTPRGRAPYQDEVEACEGYLFRELALVEPDVVVTVGALPLRVVTGRHHRLTRVHGRVASVTLRGRAVTLLPVFHPGPALHVPSVREALAADLRALRAVLAGDAGTADGGDEAPAGAGGDAAAADAPSPDPAAPDPAPAGGDQLSLGVG